MMENPFSAAQFMASGDDAASHTGGCGFCAGFGSTSTLVALEVIAREGHALLRPGGDHRLDVLAENSVAVLRVDAEGLEFGLLVAAADAPVHPASGKHVEQRHLLGQPQGVVERRQGDAGADAEVLRPRGHMGAHEVNRRTDAERAEVVFRQPHGVVAVLLHDVDALERPVVDLIQRNPPVGPGKELENAYLHRPAIVS